MQSTQPQVEYTIFQALGIPEVQDISIQTIQLGFDSQNWVIQFQTITNLRKANRHYQMIFLHELLPKYYTTIISQVDNLRSNNSKEALTLVCEIFQYQDLSCLSGDIMKPIINTLFLKSTSQKNFIKREALKSLSLLPSLTNPSILPQLQHQTQSPHAFICQLAISTTQQYLQFHKYNEIDDKLLKMLAHNVNGKRQYVQRISKEILKGIRKTKGIEGVEGMIQDAKCLEEDESNALRKEFTREEGSKGSKQSVRDFIRGRKDINVI